MSEIALVTGSSGGLGQALCRLLESKKIQVLGVTRKECDLSQTRKPVLDLIHKHAPDLVINNAGFALYGPAIQTSTASQMEILEVNAAAAIEISLEAARTLYEGKKRGTILNVSSLIGDVSAPSMALYAAAKAALTSFSKSFDAEMRPYGIRVLASLPGAIDTPFASRQKPYRHPFALSADFVAQAIWDQIQQGKTISRVGWRFRFLRLMALLFPRLAEQTLQKELKKRHS